MRWELAVVACVGCYAPELHPGAPCPNDVCPTGLFCSPATKTCELHATDARTNDASPRDAATADAPRDAPPDAPTVPMLVQQAKNYNNAAATLSATLTAPVAGHMLVMIGGGPFAPLTSVTGGGATWTLATRSVTNSNEEIWFGVTDGSSGTVTISVGNSAKPLFMLVSEWSGLATTNTLDAAHAANGVTSPASAGSITTTTRDLVLVGVSAYVPDTLGTPAPGAWTAMTPVTGMIAMQSSWYQLAPAGTFAPQITTTGTPWDAAIAALRVAP